MTDKKIEFDLERAKNGEEFFDDYGSKCKLIFIDHITKSPNIYLIIKEFEHGCSPAYHSLDYLEEECYFKPKTKTLWFNVYKPTDNYYSSGLFYISKNDAMKERRCNGYICTKSIEVEE